MSTLILTGCDAAMSAVGDLTAPILRRYALRHGYDFERVTEYLPGTHPSWQKLRLLQERLPHYDAVLWADADSVVTNPFVTVPERTGGPGLTVSTDWTWPMPEDELKHFSLGNFVMTNCPGSLEVLERASARTEWANAQLWEQQAVQMEYLLNPDIRPHIHILTRCQLNAVPALPHTMGAEPWEPGDFLCHITYTSNAERCRLIPGYEAAHFERVIGFLPPDHETGMCMDARHIAIVREILRPGKLRRALEIGVWNGSASCAFLDALSAHDIQEYEVCDVGFTPAFDALAGTRARRHHCRSTELLSLIQNWDFILVDGDHSAETGIAEARELLRLQVPCILGHDSQSAAIGFPNCEGPALIVAALQADGYTITEDAVDRPGEQTRRGFFAATKDPQIQEAITRAFALCT